MTRKFRISFTLLVLLILFIIAHNLGWFKKPENFLVDILNYSSGHIYNFSQGLNKKINFVFKTDDLIIDLEKTKQALLECQYNEFELKRLRQENKELKNQLNFIQNKNYHSLGAKVIGRNLNPISTTLIIDVGEQDGVKVGLPVIVGKGVLVGKITKIYPHSSVVRLLNDNSSSVGATIINRDKSLGLVEGGFQLSLHLNYIPQNEIINKGDMVISSGLEENMPAGLLIGVVSIIEKSPQESFQHAVLEPLIDLQKITLVSVLLN